MVRRLVILGGHGDGEVAAATLALMRGAGPRSWELLGFLNDALQEGERIAGAPVLAKLDEWRRVPEDAFFLAALHKVHQMRARSARIESLGIPQQRWATLVDPTARVPDGVSLGAGVFIGPNVVVQPGVSIGGQVSVRAGANIGHDVTVGDYCYIGPNATLCGRSAMQTGSHLGANACVTDGVRLGSYSVVGVCSAVSKHVGQDQVVFGVPARRVFVP